jgi:hypothetical protein
MEGYSNEVHCSYQEKSALESYWWGLKEARAKKLFQKLSRGTQYFAIDSAAGQRYSLRATSYYFQMKIGALCSLISDLLSLFSLGSGGFPIAIPLWGLPTARRTRRDGIKRDIKGDIKGTAKWLLHSHLRKTYQ